MTLDKKFLSVEYISTLCIGVLRYNFETIKEESLKNVNLLIQFFFNNKKNSYDTLILIYETENPVYIKILSILIELKTSNINLQENIIKQTIIDRIEKTVDDNTFIKVNKFIKYIIDSIELDKFNNSVLDLEFEKMLKFITLNISLNELLILQNKFYTDSDSIIKYDDSLKNLFIKYEESIVNNDFLIDTDNDETITNALMESASVHEECREVDILKDIKFIEKKRVAILVGASNAGKSMFLSHAAACHLMNKKRGNRKNLVFYFSFENMRNETLFRIMSNITNIENDAINTNLHLPEYREKILNIYKQKVDKNTKLIISELSPKRYSMIAIEAIIDKYLLKYKDSVVYSVMLDYVDKMIPIDNSKNLRTDEKLGNIVDDFKALTKKYDTAGVTVSQYNREGAKKSKSSDEMASGTDIGGAISKFENCDIAIFMQVNDTVKELGYSSVILYNEKHRYSTAGNIIKCRFMPQFAKFVESNDLDGGMMEGNGLNNNRFKQDNFLDTII